MKRLLNIFAAIIIAMMPMFASAAIMPADSNIAAGSYASADAQETSLFVSGNSIRVVGAAKLTLVVYNITGTKAASYVIDSDDQTIATGLPKGIYLLKVGKVVRKVSLS